MNKTELKEKIARLKQEKRAVILAHTYQPAEIQEIADFVGDSYGLSVKASQLQDAEMIVFCGVRFMAETAVILNPGKTVLMPDPDAGCPMADMIDGSQLRALKARHPGAKVVCYVNSTAEVKAESDICCTSSNAEKIIASLKAAGVEDILFVPDQYLGKFTEKKLNLGMILWDGYCPIHRNLSPEQIRLAREKHPGALVLVHPETRPEAQAAADFVLSTGQMLDLVRSRPEQEWIVGTECGILSALERENPSKKFYPVEPCLICGDMKKTTLEKVLHVMETGENQVRVPEEIARRALRSIQAMLAVK